MEPGHGKCRGSCHWRAARQNVGHAILDDRGRDSAGDTGWRCPRSPKRSRYDASVEYRGLLRMIRSTTGYRGILMRSMAARDGGYAFVDCQRKRVAAGGWFAGWLVALLLCAQGATAGSQKSFCGDGLAHDYLAPFSRMPKVTPPPQSGRLPFAPPHTVLNRPENSVLVRGGSEFSYTLRLIRGATERLFLIGRSRRGC